MLELTYVTNRMDKLCRKQARLKDQGEPAAAALAYLRTQLSLLTLKCARTFTHEDHSSKHTRHDQTHTRTYTHTHIHTHTHTHRHTHTQTSRQAHTLSGIDFEEYV
jgi:ABC-type Zn2+ transport system substrate-binding protein/surface adhesin